MVKSFHVHTLATKALSSTQHMIPHLIRVQSGFLVEPNIRNVQALADTLQATLRDLQAVLQNPTVHPPDDRNTPTVPLK
jgi:hypothetical protein